MNSNDKYNMLVNEIANSKDTDIKPKNFGLEYQEFKSIIKEIEIDGLFEKGFWALGGFYIFTGLTFKGRSFIENNDKKQYHKIEKTEINYNNSVTVGGNNSGNIIAGNNNSIQSEFNQKFNDLVETISKSNVQDKELIISELKSKKDDEIVLKKYLTSLLSRASELITVVPFIGKLLSL